MPIMTLLILVIVAVIVILLIVKSGFLKPKVKCAICGKEIGMNRYKISGTGDKTLWKCPECAHKGGFLKIEGDKVTIISEKDTEIRKKCNVCGHIYCYTAADIERNKKAAMHAATSSVLSAASAIGGTKYDMYEQSKSADSAMSRVVDYTRCPKCNSTDVVELTEAEWEIEKAAAKKTTSTISSADELKKFKDLLDSGVISQEEFDAKKKQLLGL